MNLRADEISSLIQKQIEGFEEGIELKETGRVISVGDGIARVFGLRNAMFAELLEFPGGVMGMVLNLEEDNVGAALFGIVPLTLGVIAHEGSTVLVCLNSLRLLFLREEA